MSKICRICKNEKEETEFELHRKVCKKCRNAQILLAIHSNPKRIQKRKDWNKNQIKEYHRDRARRYRETHRDKFNEYNRKYKSEKLKETEFKITVYLRNRIRKATKIHNAIKSKKTLDLIGCSLEFLKNHLQQTAINNGYSDFDINNYSGEDYHIDHIVPCDAFNLKCKYHQEICFHWSNLQILTANENIIKGGILF